MLQDAARSNKKSIEIGNFSSLVRTEALVER